MGSAPTSSSITAIIVPWPYWFDIGSAISCWPSSNFASWLAAAAIAVECGTLDWVRSLSMAGLRLPDSATTAEEC